MADITLEKMDELQKLIEMDIQQRSTHKSDILDAVKIQVKETVNGKIDKIALHLLDQDKHLEALEKKIDSIKKDTDPVVEIQKTTKSFGKFLLWLGGICGALWAILKFAKI